LSLSPPRPNREAGRRAVDPRAVSPTVVGAEAMSEPDNIVHVLLREIRAKQDEHSARFDAVEARVQHVEKQVDELQLTATYSLGQSTETQLRQVKQGVRIDDLYTKLDKLSESEKPQ
jgi:hypothetical protein